MRVAIVHDDLVQWGGAERVLTALLEIYPEAQIFTSVYDDKNRQIFTEFGNRKITTSFLQKIPGWRKLYKLLLPFYPLAFELFDFSKFDLVISHTTRFAKSIVTKPETKHICYCHTPPRFLWHFSGKAGYGLGEILLSNMRIYDTISARRVDYFIAGSENARRRIKRVYQTEAKLVYPYVDLDRFKGIESFDGGYFLVISRFNKYKRIDLAVEACFKLGFQVKVIGEMRGIGAVREAEYLRGLSDPEVVQVLAGCKALIIPGVEDFGLTSLEAQALGKPVIAFAKGGALETVIPDKTGILFNKQTVEDLQQAINQLNSHKINPQDCINNAGKFSKQNFIKNFMQAVDTLLYTR